MKTEGILFAFLVGLALLVAGCSSGQEVQGTPRVIESGDKAGQQVSAQQPQQPQQSQEQQASSQQQQEPPRANEVPPSPSPPSGAESESPKVNEIAVRAFQWGFEPSTITVKKGDAVRLMITSSDVKHGFAIPEYGLDVQLSPGDTVPVEFVADKAGTFTAYCSVPCGAGHTGMRAKLVVE